MLLIVCGETGVGKTYRNKQEIGAYLKDSIGSGKSGRKVLAFDTNDDDFPEYKTVSPTHIRKLKNIVPRRIRPFNKDGTPMDKAQKKGVIEQILKYFKSGLLVLDDIDDYLTGGKGQSIVGALCTLRHKGIDILFTHQSIAKIFTTAWQNCTWLRLHRQNDDVTRYRNRIPKYPLVRIAQLIVDEQYELATDAFATGKITEQQYTIRKSFFVYVNMRGQKLRGCSRAALIRAAKKYIDQEEGKLIRMMLAERDFKNKPIYKDRNAAIIKRIKDFLRYHEPHSLSPYSV